jgi:hypothetical protein
MMARIFRRIAEVSMVIASAGFAAIALAIATR